jgi:DNA invertase Pin-like site-specific DNA recombinase
MTPRRDAAQARMMADAARSSQSLRSSRDLLNIPAAIGEANASFCSLHDAWADTTTPHGQLVLTVLGGLAEF